MKILRRISVFMPCLLANFNSVLLLAKASPFCAGVFGEAAAAFCCLSTKGSPPQAAPTSHHFPLVSAEWRSSSVTRKGSWARTTAEHTSDENGLHRTKNPYRDVSCSNQKGIFSFVPQRHSLDFGRRDAWLYYFWDYSRFQAWTVFVSYDHLLVSGQNQQQIDVRQRSLLPIELALDNLNDIFQSKRIISPKLLSRIWKKWYKHAIKSQV